MAIDSLNFFNLQMIYDYLEELANIMHRLKMCHIIIVNVAGIDL